ncbi:MAG: hypothetical protein ABIP75_15160 [Pyrinomonadaceae bacterium]
MLNSSLKSEFTNIFAFYEVRMHDKFPGGRELRGVGLRLPKFNIERPVVIFNPAHSLNNFRTHSTDYITGVCLV